jgi:hypothetical protein
VANLICGTFKLGDRQKIIKYKKIGRTKYVVCIYYLLSEYGRNKRVRGCSKKNYYKEDNQKIPGS